MSILCPECKMLTVPMGTQCEFCGYEFNKKKREESKNENI